MDYFQPDLNDIIDALDRSKVVQRLSGKRIFLTGAAGFLGRWIVRTVQELNRSVLNEPCKIIAVDAMADDKGEFLDANTEFIHHNLSVKMGMDIGAHLDFIIHAAGIASPYWYQKKPLETIDVAVHGSRLALELAAKNDARYLFLSSSEVYQTPEVVPTPETYIGAIPTLGSRSCYDVSKAMGETLAHVYYVGEHHVDTGIVRIFNSFGVGLKESDHRIMARLGSAAKGGWPLKLYGAGGGQNDPTRTYCPVANTIYGIFLALLNGQPGEAYNIGADEPEIDVCQLVNFAQAALGERTRLRWEVAAIPEVYRTEPMRRCPDIAKAQAHLGYSLIVDLHAGLKRFLDWSMSTYTGAQ